MSARAGLLAIGLAATPFGVAAHPHIFVDVALRVELTPERELRGVEITWRYDELYSLLMFEDLGLDSDFDGRLNDSELAFLDGFDMNWIDGFEGDMYVTRHGEALTLGPPEPRGTDVENGQIITRHFRTLSGPASGVLLEAYDPTFYTAYALDGAVTVEGDCAANVTPADLAAAYANLEELMYGMSQEQADTEFPQVGAQFADKVTLQCD